MAEAVVDGVAAVEPEAVVDGVAVVDLGKTAALNRFRAHGLAEGMGKGKKGRHEECRRVCQTSSSDFLECPTCELMLPGIIVLPILRCVTRLSKTSEAFRFEL